MIGTESICHLQLSVVNGVGKRMMIICASFSLVSGKS